MIRIPAFTAFAPQRAIDKEFGFDRFARTALETVRDSWQPMPTCNLKEFGAFFSEKNYKHIKAEVLAQSKPYKPEEEDIFDAMIQAFQLILPRSDQMDERREIFTDAVTRSYVAQLNEHCIDKLVVDTKAAGGQADHYYKYMQGPWDMDEDVYNIDTTTKHNCAVSDFSWRNPW
jgi:hypothetical protein